MGVETISTISQTSGSVENEVPDQVKNISNKFGRIHDYLFYYSTPLIENWYVHTVVYKARQNLINPEVGMIFQSEEQAYVMYNTYAGKVGFSIRKSKTKHRQDGSLCQKYIVCSSQGQRENESSQKDITRTGCDAVSSLVLAKRGFGRCKRY